MTDTPRPSPLSVGLLAGLGALASLVALFLWGDLLRSRAGGAPFCPLGTATQCTALWDGPFASMVHSLSGLPVAGWGLVWGLVALALPIAALVRMAGGKPLAETLSAIRLTAAVGVITTMVLLAVALAARSFCAGCFVTYAIVGGYAGVALLSWKHHGLPDFGRAVSLMVALVAGFYVLLLYPGMQTPRTATEQGRSAIAAAPAGAAGGDAVASFIATLAPEVRQGLSDTLEIHRNGAALPVATPRALVGPAEAPIRITTWSDVLCGHCSALHETLTELMQRSPGRFNVEPRHFPLDGTCNPGIQMKERPVRCVAAKAQICVEPTGRAHEYAGALYAKQNAGLTSEMVLELGAPYLPRPQLEACIASPDTAKTLQADIDSAMRYEPDGTPIVTVNGKLGTSYAPFLYTMILTGGSLDHPAFSTLPAPNRNAHVH